ncbi:MAG TPA: hypothetical protein VMS17_03365 [Gemmataceae bacterium]|nr:hypothetical protein [Gemmataceae bacterium]
MEPPITNERRWIGPIITLFRRLIAKCVRWYIQPQTNALDLAVAQIQEELEEFREEFREELEQFRADRVQIRGEHVQLTKIYVEAQALAVNQYQELFRRLAELEARLPAAPSASKAA